MAPMQVLQTVAGIAPALLAILVGGVIALLALPLDRGRRDYTERMMVRCTDFAAVMVGASRKRAQPPR
jgi:hypothetical protein